MSERKTPGSIIDRVLREAWQKRPQERVDLILRISGNTDERASFLAQKGIEIKRQHRLTRSISIRCTGELALTLASLSWIERIEQDRSVHALGR